MNIPHLHNTKYTTFDALADMELLTPAERTVAAEFVRQNLSLPLAWSVDAVLEHQRRLLLWEIN